MSFRRCAAKTCFNLQGCRPNLKFFPFPKDETACRIWAAQCDRSDLAEKPVEQLSKLLLCADHFEPHWFLNPKYKTVFIRTGQPIPTIFHNNLADFVPKSLKKQFKLKYSSENEKDGSSEEIPIQTIENNYTIPEKTDENSYTTVSEESALSRKHGCHKMCRLCACLVYEDKLVSILDDESEQQNIVSKINRFLPEKVLSNDGLPHHVCSSCITKLNECNDAVDSFIAADKKLRNLFGNSNSSVPALTYVRLAEDFPEQNASTQNFILQSQFVNVGDESIPEDNKRDLNNDGATNVFVVTNSINLNSASLQETSNLDPLCAEEYCEALGDEQEKYAVEFLQSEQIKWPDCENSTEVKDSVKIDLDDQAERVYMCLVCRKIFKEKDKLLIHEISEHAVETKKDEEYVATIKKYRKREVHKCAECGTSFPGLKPLKRHIREYHIPAENICEYCGAHYKIKSQLDVHRRLHTDEKPFSCSVCNESFHFKKALKRHKRIHIEPKSLTCTVCNKTFSNRSAMWRHEQIHSTNRSVLCYLCGKVLSNSQSLRVHMRTHSTDRPCSCPTCGKTFRDNISVNKHMIMHSAVKNFKCDICGRAFYSKGLVKQHKLSHSGVKPYKCEVCGAAFNRLGNLNQHKKKHVQDGTLEHLRSNLTHMCVICGKMMKSELTLKYHLAKHTGEKKPFDCEVCGKRFVAVDPYRVHMRIHTGERPYECNLCEKTFRSAFTLKQHSALHKDEFPYPCTFCDRRFKRLQSLIVHKRTHTGEKPHPCPICGRGFAQKGDMIKHTKTHNRERKPVTMELEHITELVLSDPEITSEFLIDMPIVEVETEINSDIHTQMQSEFPSQIQSAIDEEMKSDFKPGLGSEMQTGIPSGMEPCIHMEIQPDIHSDMSTDITNGISSDDLHSEIQTVIETEIYGP